MLLSADVSGGNNDDGCQRSLVYHGDVCVECFEAHAPGAGLQHMTLQSYSFHV